MINIPIWLFVIMIVLSTPFIILVVLWIISLISMMIADKKPSKSELEKAKQCPDKLDPNYNPEYIERKIEE